LPDAAPGLVALALAAETGRRHTTELVALRCRGVHADHLARAVHQRAAGVAGLDVRVHLDQGR